MSKEDKPLDYERRLRDTKGVAQRLDLDYLKRAGKLTRLRRQAVGYAVVVAMGLSIPILLGVGAGRKLMSNGPVSEAHAFYENRCEVCHSRPFGGIPDNSCRQCHDVGPHPAKTVDPGKSHESPACVQCHLEHRGHAQLAEVANGNCTSCHGNLLRSATGIKLRAPEISAFRQGRHPEFSTASFVDRRPLRLNHAIHMPAEPKKVRGIELPMKCADCHETDRYSPRHDPLPVTFERNCRRCHARELEFDIHQVFGPKPMPAPHTRDKKTIDEYIVAAYRGLLNTDPAVARRPIGNDFNPPPNAAAWLERMVHDSEDYLFNRKCGYCHTAEPMTNRVHRVSGRYSAEKSEGDPWLVRGEFGHRAHRAVECTSCHTAARTSKSTEEVLIPGMNSCLPCHGGARATLDRCSHCHLYHNRFEERDPKRLPTEKLMGQLLGHGRPQ